MASAWRVGDQLRGDADAGEQRARPEPTDAQPARRAAAAPSSGSDRSTAQGAASEAPGRRPCELRRAEGSVKHVAANGGAEEPGLVPRRTSVGPATVPYLEGGVGRPLVFLHGWGVGPAAYRGGLARIAAAGFRVLAPCLPAFGGTPDLPTEECSFAGYARFVAAWLDALGVTEPVAVVGHSFGGGVAIQFAADRPERVAGLVLCNAAGGLVRATGGGREDGSATRPLWDWGRRLGADLLRPESLVRVVPAVLECAVPNLFANPRGLWRVAGFVRRADLMGELASVRARGVPVRVVWSDRDLLVSYRSFVAQREAAGGGIVVPGPHSWLIASPERFADVVVGELEAADLEQRADRRARGALDDRGGHCAGIGGEPGSRLPRARPVGR